MQRGRKEPPEILYDTYNPSPNTYLFSFQGPIIKPKDINDTVLQIFMLTKRVRNNVLLLF